ncbi:unnamed protein product [Discula destructiva]
MSQNTTFAGKVAVITGGSKGIGKAACIALGKAGASVVVNYSSDSQAADEVVKAITPGKALAIKADVSSVAGVEHLVKQTVQSFGQIDILVANAAVLPMKDLKSTTEADFDATFALNVKGPYFLAQRAVPHMPKGSHII